jgi:hypothetical protein
MKKIENPASYQLIYISGASTSFSKKDLIGLLAQSRKFNHSKEITGLLLYAGGHFMQLLEGAREEIKPLMERITKDGRHNQVDVLEEGPVKHRQFPEWSMAFLDFASPEVRALPGYSCFLDAPPQAAALVDKSEGNSNLLHYFKSIMLASNTSLLHLAEDIVWQKMDDSD